MDIKQIQLLLGLAIGVTMLGMGLSLKPKDFIHIIKSPKSVITGLIAQMIVLPLFAYGIIRLFDLNGGLAVGLMIISACPGGAVSNMFTLLAKGNLVLSVTLTAVTTVVTIFTLPFIIDFSVETFLQKGNTDNIVDKWEFIKVLLALIAVPVSLGMIINRLYPNFADKSQKVVKILSVVMLTAIVSGAVISNREKLIVALPLVGAAAILLNVSTMLNSFIISKLVKLSNRSATTITIEGGIQNGTLALTLSTIGILGQYEEILLPSALYSVWMFFSGGIFSYIMSKRNL